VQFCFKALAVLALFISGQASAQLAPAVCIPYSIPVQQTIIDCGPGMTGTKFKTMTKLCPSGEVKESASYDTSACRTSATNSSGTLTTEARCRITPGACAITSGALVPANCPSGRKWSLAGSAVAHCVDEDPVCPWGTSLKQDLLGNPRCEQNTCTSNQVLKSDGQTCGCSSGLQWNGSRCVAPAPPACPTNVILQSEPCGHGRALYYRTTSCAGVVSYWWDGTSCNYSGL
jgi:hypothetical protein